MGEMTASFANDVELPVVLFDRDWVLYAFKTLDDAENWVELIDVEDREYVGFGSRGRRIAFSLEPPHSSGECRPRPPRIRAYFTADVVDPEIILHLVRAALPAGCASGAGAEEVLREAIARFGETTLRVPDAVVRSATEGIRLDDEFAA